MPKFVITGTQGFRTEATDPETAFGQAKAASRKFAPIEIEGPQGRLSLAELEKLDAEAKKRKGI